MGIYKKMLSNSSSGVFIPNVISMSVNSPASAGENLNEGAVVKAPTVWKLHSTRRSNPSATTIFIGMLDTPATTPVEGIFMPESTVA
jgi:hypothetical protein